jgi:alkanesulfonate monooxygenase SsuD/methylene tetrahydromethanopterin reductase-like flavin-dependent oxidoreductase (luciferase family)/FAD/FMN-containing dehydrogenase
VDYGHPLQFGTFLTPTSHDPQAPVERARLAEELGFDLVTFQDHPYQPRFLDTWTLLSWVAGRTSRIRIAPNVLNVPMRPPAVVARAAASLDLLSGGRVELALGAGAFWDAIEAMGAPRLTRGESVEALTEAIEVIRAMWAAGEPPVRLPGRHHRLDGAQPGPAPAHDIPIWLGAVKPRMLRLVGRAADGWLPSLSSLAPGELAAGQAIVDEAASDAGRDPREIRRLLNIAGQFNATSGGLLIGPPKQWVDELLPLAVDDGVNTFILATDDTDTLRRFAAEVAPALRESVARERDTRGTVEGTVPSLAIRAKRRDGIDYDAVPASLRQTAVEPGNAGYGDVRSTYLRGGSPGLVLRPGSTAEVVEALAFARSQQVPLGIRSGGHGISGRSTNDGGIVLDLSRLNTIEVLDEATRRVRIGPGARWGQVAAALQPLGWALSSGDYGGVGVGGLATAGGIGWLVREHGLTIDHLRAVEMVLADGSVVRADASQNADLFWGVRGAGANFGIVTAFEFEADEVGNVGFGRFVFDASDTAGFLQRWGAVVEAAPRDLTSFLIMGRPRPGQPLVAQVMAVVDSADAQTIVDRLQPLAGVARLVDYAIQVLPYPAIVDAPEAAHRAQGEPVTRSALVDHLTPEFAAAAAELVRSGETYFFQIRSVGGAVADVHPSATAYANRSANFSVVAFGASRTRLDRRWDAMAEHFAGSYLSFESDRRPERLHDAFPPATLERLRALKLRYDPDNVFRDNFNVAPPIPLATG